MQFEAWSSLARQTVRPRTLVITAAAVASVSSHQLSGALEGPHPRGKRATAEDGLPPPLARQPWGALAKVSGVVVCDASGAAMEFAATEVVATEAAADTAVGAVASAAAGAVEGAVAGVWDALAKVSGVVVSDASGAATEFAVTDVVATEAAAADTAVGAAAGAVAGAVGGAAVEGGGAQAAVAARGINVAAQVESPPSPSRVDVMRRRRVDCLPGLSHQDDERLHRCFPTYQCVNFRDLQQTNKRMWRQMGRRGSPDKKHD